MSDPTQKSVSFPILPTPNDKRPLPEIIADYCGFHLAYVDHEDGKRYYAVQDWIYGVAQLTDRAHSSKLWDNLKRRLKKAEIETSSWWRSLPYRASDGKTYKRDHAAAEFLYQITQRMDANTGLRDHVLQFLAKSGVVVDEVRIDPDKAIDAAIAAYKRQGKSDTWIEIRIRSKTQRLLFTSAFRNSMLVPPQPKHFGIITNEMRLGLWKRNTATLKTQMGLNAKDNLRDHQSEIALTYELLAEQISTRKLEQRKNLSFDETKTIVRTTSQFVGRQADETSHELGIDIATDRSLLDQ